MALFTDDFSDMAVEAAKLGRIWEHFYLYEEKHSLTVVLYQVSDQTAQKIHQMAQKENLNCYMSENLKISMTVDKKRFAKTDGADSKDM